MNRDVRVGVVGSVLLVVALVGIFVYESGNTPTVDEKGVLPPGSAFAPFHLAGCTLLAVGVPVDRAAAQAMVPDPLVVARGVADAGVGLPVADDRTLFLAETLDCPEGPTGPARFTQLVLFVENPQGNLSFGSDALHTFALRYYTNDDALTALLARAGAPAVRANVTLEPAAPGDTSLQFTAAGEGETLSGGAFGGPLPAGGGFPAKWRQFHASGESLGWIEGNQTGTVLWTGDGGYTASGGPAGELVGPAGATTGYGTGSRPYALDGRLVPARP